MLGRDLRLLSRAREALTVFFGPILEESRARRFSYTGYYDEELGKDLKRKFVFFARPRDPSDLVEAKRFTVEVEMRMARHAGRTMARCVNLDPGYLTQAKVVLASGKDFSHRIYLGRGVHAEATLSFVNGSYRPHSYTFPEYRDEKNIALFNRMRQICFPKKPAPCTASPP